MQNIDFKRVNITGGFWKARQELLKSVTAISVYNRFKDTHRFDALKCTWREGEPDCPHIFWDSDVAKWIEGVALMAAKDNCDELIALAEEAIKDVMENADEGGYFNSHYLVTEKDSRFTNRGAHELYCAGHFIEAAIAYYHATGKEDFLKATCRFADCIERAFKTEKTAAFITPGHQELELALVKLYRTTGEKRYLELAKFFVDERCNNTDATYDRGNILNCYSQSELPAREFTEAKGHSVRATYYWAAMADLALEYGDDGLKAACERLFENVVNQKMYITGGIGSDHDLECFTKNYDLPNEQAYAETCAAIGLALFCHRMQKFGPDSRYADIIERVIYNGAISGISMDGKRFFYTNPLEIDLKVRGRNQCRPYDVWHPATRRVEVFDCSCCPPNIMRFLASIGDHIYSKEGETLYVNQFIESTAEIDQNEIKISTDYPVSGEVRISCKKPQRLAVRIPGWCEDFCIDADYEIKNGYALINATTEVNINFEMTAKTLCANPKVRANAGRLAVMRGPVVYCAEAIDNGGEVHDILLDADCKFTTGENEFSVPNLHTTAYRFVPRDSLYLRCDATLEKTELKLIPYFAFANREESEMLVWLLRKF